MTSNKDKAFALFHEGKTASSPEVKALGIKASTRYHYHSEWKSLGKPKHYPYKPKVSKPTTGLHVTTPGGERIGGIDETTHRFEAEEEKPVEELAEELPEEELPKDETEGTEETQEEAKPEEEKVRLPLVTGEKPKEGTISADVVGLGIPISINISIKTLALYQIAASASGNNLDIGDFLDDCVADFFRGRGLDLGLVKLNMGVKENAR